MWALVAALTLGLFLASPQLWQALRYYPHSIRAGKTAAQKMALGNLPLSRLLRNLVAPTVEPVDGVFGPEAMTFIGLWALPCLLLARNGFWWFLACWTTLLAMGTRTPFFKLTAWTHLRIPARYSYWVGVSLAMLALEGFAHLPARLQPVVLFLQATSLVLILPRLWPMLPYVQRWERPSRAFSTPLTQYLAAHLGVYRVSGLPYPLRTGQVNHLQTLGYNGGSQARWMAAFRQDTNPNGSGAHDWFAGATAEDRDLLAWYGVKYAYTMRPLTFPWRVTRLPHLYENAQVKEPPAWPSMRG